MQTQRYRATRGFVSVESQQRMALYESRSFLSLNGLRRIMIVWTFIQKRMAIFSWLGIMQKFVDQLSRQTPNYDPKNFESQKVPMKVICKDLLTAY